MAKILVIEDEAAILETTSELLELAGFEILRASNGEIGLKMAEKHFPDAILCDVQMPKMDGYTVLNALRANPQTAKIPCAFVSSNADEERIQMVKEMGLGYLLKPFTSEELYDFVKNLLKA